MAEVGIRELLEAGVHFGHQTRRWNPKMRRFIFGERTGIYIIDLLKTEALLEQARGFAADIAHRGGTVLFVGTKKQARDAIKETAEDGGNALRQQPLAGRPADELPDDLAAHQAPARPRALRVRGPAAAAAHPRAPVRPGRPREAAGEPRRGQEHAAGPRRPVRRRPQDRGDRGARGPAPADPDHRAGRHQLRSRRHHLRHPRQRRRDPLLRADHPRARRGRLRGPSGLPRPGGAGAPRGRGAGAPRGRGEGAPRGRGARAPGGRGGRCAPGRARRRGRPDPDRSGRDARRGRGAGGRRRGRRGPRGGGPRGRGGGCRRAGRRRARGARRGQPRPAAARAPDLRRG